MQVRVPYSRSYAYVKIIVVTPVGDVTTTVDTSVHDVVDIALPGGVAEDEVDVYSCFLAGNRQMAYGCGPVLLKSATRKPAPIVEPAVEPIESPLSAVIDESLPAEEPKSALDCEQEAAERYDEPKTEPNVWRD